MATVLNQNEEDIKQGGGTPVGGTAGADAQAGSPSAGVAGTASPVKQNAATQNQSGYTDVGSYLNANQAGTQKMGQDVANNLTNKYTNTKQGVTQSANDLINQVNQGYTKENADVVKQAAANPNAVADNSGLLSQFQGQLNDTYGGPTNWADYGTQQGNVAQAKQYGNLANTPGGLNVYAQELEGPTASQGVNQLDSLLLGGNEGARGAINTAAGQYNDLGDYLNQQNQAATGAIGAGQTAAQNASQNALDAFTGANGTLTNLNTNVNNATAKALTDAQGQQESLRADLNNGGITDRDLQSLGISADQWQSLKDELQRANTSQYMTGHNFGASSATQAIDPRQALQQQDPNQLINAGTVATPEQYAQMSAIQKLLGDKTPQGAAINPALASLAGTYNPSQLNQFDYQGLKDYATQTADAERQAAQDQANQLTAAADAAHADSKNHGFGGFTRKLSNLTRPITSTAAYFNPLTLPAALANNQHPDMKSLITDPLANPLNLVPKEIKEAQKKVK